MTTKNKERVTADKLLFTPGPLTVSPSVKQAMLRDLGSRDPEFIGIVADIRQRLLALAGVADAGYEAILIQGSGTFGIEAVLSSCIPTGGKLLVIVNGAYGRRMALIARANGIACSTIDFDENMWPDFAVVENAVRTDGNFTHIAIVHSETTSGLLNPLAQAGGIARRYGLVYIVDAVSSFGGVPLNPAELAIDFLISSVNKCLQGVPGFCFVLARHETLLAAEGRARTLSLDLAAQWRGLETDGQFRFTPPTHAILAFAQALKELEDEGGVTGRAARYRAIHEALIAGMRLLGFREYVPPELRCHIVTTFLYPQVLGFDFSEFYARLSSKGCVIYPGKVTRVDCFRIGTIGHLFPADIGFLLTAIAETLAEMGITVPLQK
jgi:2-aminoethylphosphonate-pyruvate transaminase